MEPYYVATFHSTHQALDFEKVLLKNSLEVKMIPVPRLLSSSCGIAARFSADQWESVCSLLLSGEAGLESLFYLQNRNNRLQAEQIRASWDKN